MSSSAIGEPAETRHAKREHLRRTRRVLGEMRGHLTKRALRLIGFLAFAYLVMKLIPGLENALKSLEGVSLPWVIGLMAVETLSEMGYVVSWRGILDPEGLLQQDGRGRHLGSRVAWAQLGGGMIVPGGTLGSMGVGAWMLHRLGMSMDRVAERQFVLMFLNTAVDALAVILFGLGLAIGLFNGTSDLALTLLPAVLVALALALVLFVTRHAERYAARLQLKRPKAATALTTLTAAVDGTHTLLRRRGSGKTVLGAVAYLGFDMLVLWGAFTAIDTKPVPTFAIVAISYLIGSLAGSIPLPANLGAVTGMAGMLIVFGVDHNDAIAAVVLYQAIGFIVPLIGGGIAYFFLRRQFGAMHEDEPGEPDDPGEPAAA
jgi:uncharacterized protein (TIRG00374 family)